MRSVRSRRGLLEVVEVPEPPGPGPGQAVVEVLASTICGTDLHVHAHTEEYLEVADASGTTAMMWDPERGVHLGHCYTVRVLEVGAGVTDLAEGDVVAGIASVVRPDGSSDVLGFSDEFPGGFSERMLVSVPAMLRRVPESLDPVHAAFLEPLMVGEVSVRNAAIPDGAPAVVLGAGQVGLGIVAALRRHGRHPVVVAEPSAARREVAAQMGATAVVDTVTETWVDALAATGAGAPPTVFDTTGVAGMLASLFEEVPPHTHVVEVSGQYLPDPIRTGLAVKKNLRLTFTSRFDPSSIGLICDELASGELDVSGWVSDVVDLDGVPGAFERLAGSDDVVAIAVVPGGRGTS